MPINTFADLGFAFWCKIWQNEYDGGPWNGPYHQLQKHDHWNNYDDDDGEKEQAWNLPWECLRGKGNAMFMNLLSLNTQPHAKSN